MAASLRLTREQLAIITGGDPRAIKAFEDFFAALNNLGSHAATHQPGGADPLAVDAAAATGSLRTLGAGAAQAAAGNHNHKLDDLAAPDDNTDLDATAAAHGLLPKLSGVADDALLGDGTWGPPAGGWHKIVDPPTGWLISKVAGWTADSFSGGLTVDFSGEVTAGRMSAGTRAVRVVVLNANAGNYVFWRPGGDANVSNTPNASQEYAFLLTPWEAGEHAPCELWLSATYTVDIAVLDVVQDIYVAYPVGYLP
jgi:hypothetical protein